MHNENEVLTQEQQFETKLSILADILSKKRDALLAVLAISENQESLYASPPSPERRDFLVAMGKQKQEHIDTVLTADEVFQGIFESVSYIFQDKGTQYAKQVRYLQAAIKDVLEIDVKIRAQEEKTKVAAQTAWGQPTKTDPINPANTNYILEQYKNNNRTRPKG